MTAKEFIETLKKISQEYSGDLPKREILALAKHYQQMSVLEAVTLLKDNNHRLGAVSILDWKARNKLPKKKRNTFTAHILTIITGLIIGV